jgi:hypothetical protein
MNTKENKERFVFAMMKDGKVYRYMVRFTQNGYKEYVGCFKTKEEAIAARNLHMDKNHTRILKVGSDE